MKRVISLILAAALFLPAAVNAATWVTVSSWAYNSVSNFKKEGLLPESFENVDDYTQNITRLQFAELLYAVLLRTKCIDGSDMIYNFEDTDSKAAIQLAGYEIMMGEDTGMEHTRTAIGSMIEITHAFYPDRLITREEMAAVVYRAVERWCSYLVTDSVQGLPADYNEISDWALESVRKLQTKGLIHGMDDGTFRPKDNLTIEQAMTVLYSFFNTIPTSAGSDGANIHSEYEQLVQRYENGLEETKQNDVLYLKNGGEVLMEFETDIYTNIFCAVKDGIIYAAAQNRFAKTDVYNAETQELLFKIPYPISSMDEDYIITKTQTTGRSAFGVYDYSGNELLLPEYSLSEIETVKANNFIAPEETKLAANGWIYYYGTDDCLYRTDTNGENGMKISDHYCSGLRSVENHLFYTGREEWDSEGLFCMNTDGTNEQEITTKQAYLWNGGYEEWYINEDGYGYDMDFKYEWRDADSFRKYSSNRNNYLAYSDYYIVYHENGWVYYYEYEGSKTSLWRVRVTDSGTEKEKLTGNYDISDVQLRDGKIYFIGDAVEAKNGMLYGSLYCYDNGEIKMISDLDIFTFGFSDDCILMQTGKDQSSALNMYLADMDGSNVRRARDFERAENRADEEYIPDRHKDKNLSDDRFSVYLVYGSNGNRYYACVSAEDGIEHILPTYSGTPDLRIGDTLYWVVNDFTPDRENNCIVSYDMNTGKSKNVAQNVMEINMLINPTGEDWLTYTDYNYNIWRYDASDDAVSEVFPNKGIKKYGKALCLVFIDDAMYKVDEDGNFVLMADNCTGGYLYSE